jgi:hypothetical protein
MMSLCDFCNAPHPAWVYPARNFEIADHGWGSDGGWAACEDCAQLIESEQYKQLVNRRMVPSGLQQAFKDVPGLGGHLSKRELREIEIQTERLFNKFRRARKGGRRLIEAA